MQTFELICKMIEWLHPEKHRKKYVDVLRTSCLFHITRVSAASRKEESWSERLGHSGQTGRILLVWVSQEQARLPQRSTAGLSSGASINLCPLATNVPHICR